MLCLFLHICDNRAPPPLQVFIPLRGFFLRFSAAKVNGDAQAHQRLDVVVAAEQ